MHTSQFIRAGQIALAVTAVAVTMVAPPSRATTTQKAHLATFAGYWGGHGRMLTITRSGSAKESIGDGCCDPVVDLHLNLSHPRGDKHVGSVDARVTWMQVHDRSAYGSDPLPRVGQTGRLRLRYGVITESLTHTTYCNAAAAAKSRCGA